MGMSSTYHLFKDYKYMVKKTLVRLDYAGISILIAGSNTPPIYYSLYCDETTCMTKLFLNAFRLEITLYEFNLYFLFWLFCCAFSS